MVKKNVEVESIVQAGNRLYVMKFHTCPDCVCEATLGPCPWPCAFLGEEFLKHNKIRNNEY